jgi:hypothetical protein
MTVLQCPAHVGFVSIHIDCEMLHQSIRLITITGA